MRIFNFLEGGTICTIGLVIFKFDMFSDTSHVETVCSLTKKDSK